MENQVEKTGMERLNRLRKEAKELGITGIMKADEFEAAIAQTKTGGVDESATALTPDEAQKIDARLKYEEEAREKFRRERQIKIEVASITAESESLSIKIDLPDNPNELQLAKARQALGLKKKEVRPSLETVGIEASKRGYYIFTNRIQDDASHTVNLGGKYVIHLIADQVHVLSEYHIKTWGRIAVAPIYERVPVSGPLVEGQMKEVCKRTGGRRRFSFEYLGEAPKDAPFGLVTDTKILNELKQEQLS